jgi:hypothetical protein
MRLVASLLFAAQLLVVTHALWHHHDHEGQSGGEAQSCEYCLVLDQPRLPSSGQLAIVPADPPGWPDRDRALPIQQAGRQGPACIRGPPRLLAA